VSATSVAYSSKTMTTLQAKKMGIGSHAPSRYGSPDLHLSYFEMIRKLEGMKTKDRVVRCIYKTYKKGRTTKLCHACHAPLFYPSCYSASHMMRSVLLPIIAHFESS
jgi:hypothetical protein